MENAHEIEIKLLTKGGQSKELLDHPRLQGSRHHERLSAIYYDTADWRLYRACALLRTRVTAEGREQTFKLSGNADPQLIKRGEWTVRLDEEKPVIATFPAPARDAIENIADAAALQPFARVEIERETRMISHGGSSIEAAFDTGTIIADDRSESISELELELKQGRVIDLIHLALELPDDIELRWSHAAKGERAHHLATGERMSASKASPIRLDKAMSTATTFQIIAWNCLDQLLRNYQLVIDDRDEKALHQTRVALRRLRASFSIFRNVIADAQFERLRPELKAVATALGPTRDLDVLIANLKSQDSVQGSSPEAFEELMLQLEQQRADTYAEAGRVLGGGAFQKLLLETAAWVEDGPWLTDNTENDAWQGRMPVIAFASRELKRRRQKLAKAERRFRTLTVGERHRVRIQVKKLRYATDFFQSLFATGRNAAAQTAFLSVLEKLQDCLGELNDIATSRRAGAVDLSGLDETSRARLSALLDQLFEAHGGTEKRLLRNTEKALDRLVMIRRFWKKA